MATLQKKSSKFLPCENYFYLLGGRTEGVTNLFFQGLITFYYGIIALDSKIGIHPRHREVKSLRASGVKVKQRHI